MTLRPPRDLRELRYRERVAWGFLVLLWAVLGLLFGARYFRQSADAQRYEQAPLCPERVGALEATGARVGPAECRVWLKARVSRLTSQRAGRGLRRFVEVRLPDGSLRRGQLPERDFWRGLARNDEVGVELWRDRLMQVRHRGLARATSENPSWDSSNIAAGTTAIAVLMGLAVLIFVWNGRRLRRELQVAGPPGKGPPGGGP